MIELKPCPFCGKPATERECSCGHTGNGEFTATYSIGCDECKISFVRQSRFRLVKGQPHFICNGYDEAVKAWNRRAKE
jgi:hypothetical protein